MYVETDLDPSSRRTRQRNSKLMDNLSKRCHYQIVQLALDCSSVFPVVLESNERYPARNNGPSTANVTMDFSAVVI